MLHVGANRNNVIILQRHTDTQTHQCIQTRSCPWHVSCERCHTDTVLNQNQFSRLGWFTEGEWQIGRQGKRWRNLFLCCRGKAWLGTDRLFEWDQIIFPLPRGWDRVPERIRLLSQATPPYLREWRDKKEVRRDWSSTWRMLSVCCWK